MFRIIKKIAAFSALLLGISGFLFAEDGEFSFGENIASMEGHRFVEVRGAIPVFPALTSHGALQSFVVGFSDVFGEIFSGGSDNYSASTPKFATDLNVTFFPGIANYRIGFMLGVALDVWNYNSKNSSSDDDFSMNFFYTGAHFDYGHWVTSKIGTRISIYGEISLGVIGSDNSSSSDLAFWFDICPIGVQFCPEKHIGIYFEMPHIGARPFLQTGISIGL